MSKMQSVFFWKKSLKAPGREPMQNVNGRQKEMKYAV